jgi:hypothetical protein
MDRWWSSCASAENYLYTPMHVPAKLDLHPEQSLAKFVGRDEAILVSVKVPENDIHKCDF